MVLSTFFGTFLNLEHYFTFPALLNTFLTFEQKLSIEQKSVSFLVWSLIRKSRGKTFMKPRLFMNISARK